LLRVAKYLAAISTMMFSSVQRMEFFIAFKTILYIFVKDPFLFWTKRSFYYFFDLLIHQNAP